VIVFIFLFQSKNSCTLTIFLLLISFRRLLQKHKKRKKNLKAVNSHGKKNQNQCCLAFAMSTCNCLMLFAASKCQIVKQKDRNSRRKHIEPVSIPSKTSYLSYTISSFNTILFTYQLSQHYGFIIIILIAPKHKNSGFLSNQAL
jgi:hypothetical protein